MKHHSNNSTPASVPRIVVDDGAPVTAQPISRDSALGSGGKDWISTVRRASPDPHTLKLYVAKVEFVTEKIVVETCSGVIQHSSLSSWVLNLELCHISIHPANVIALNLLIDRDRMERVIS